MVTASSRNIHLGIFWHQSNSSSLLPVATIDFINVIVGPHIHSYHVYEKESADFATQSWLDQDSGIGHILSPVSRRFSYWPNTADPRDKSRTAVLTANASCRRLATKTWTSFAGSGSRRRDHRTFPQWLDGSNTQGNWGIPSSKRRTRGWNRSTSDIASSSTLSAGKLPTGLFYRALPDKTLAIKCQ